MYNVATSDSEQLKRFNLCLLLLHVVGAISFEYMITVNGVQYSSFKEAALHWGLLSDNSEWKR